MKPLLCIDLDDTIANFSKAAPYRDPHEMYGKGFFLNLEVMPGAREAVRQLWKSDKFDIHILSKPVADSPISYTEKSEWIAKHFPYLLHKITLTQDKSLFKGDYLIDDYPFWSGKFPGEFILFNKLEPVKSWQTIVEYLLKIDAMHAIIE